MSRVLIAWLEDEKIRKLEPTERGPIRAVNSNTWNDALVEYLKQLEAPEFYYADKTFANSQLYQLIIDFLISRAIADEYADRAKLYASGAAKAAAIATANVAKQLGLDESNLASAVDTSKVLDEESDEARKLIIDALNPLCEILRLPKIDMKTSEAEIRAISREIRRCIQNDVAPFLVVQSAPAAGVRPDDENAGQVRSEASKDKTRFRRFAEEVFVQDSTRRQRKALMAAATKATSLLTAAEAKEALRATPLGQPTTGVERVDDAVRALRLLYVQDLRDLQRTINDMIEAGQEFTANPQTNADLGSVGR